MTNYYKNKLSGERLKLCYDCAPPRVVQYLENEIDFVKNYIKMNYSIIELGCGYGRITEKLAQIPSNIVGIDISQENINFALKNKNTKCSYFQMDATQLVFTDNLFDVVLCLQNGVCAFRVDQISLLKEAIRVCQQNGFVIFSTYSHKFWYERLEWFKIQSELGLLGELDLAKCCEGKIVCKDGFESGSLSKDDILNLSNKLEIRFNTIEIDNSSLFFIYKNINY